jgi:uncharacterized protein (DUF58 family)
MIAAAQALLLDRLAIGGRAAGTASYGSRRTHVHGAGLEFHEYRAYQPGDDPRSIDWVAEARLQQLVVRVSRAEGGARVHLLVDVSASMRLGAPSKFACARHLAGALCYVAIARREAASVSTFASVVHAHLGAASGRQQLVRVLALLEAAAPAGPSSLDDSLIAFGAAVRGPGLVVVLSDFLDAGRSLAGLRYLLHRGLTPAVVQIIAPEDVDPIVTDETEIFDVERDSVAPLVVDGSVVDAYRLRVREHCASLRDFCASHRLAWAQVSPTLPFAGQIARLEHSGLLIAHG